MTTRGLSPGTVPAACFDYIGVKSAKPLADYRVDVIFKDGTHGIFDCTPYLKDKYWQRLENETYFRQLRVECGTLTWSDDIDIAPEEVWHDSVKI